MLKQITHRTSPEIKKSKYGIHLGGAALVSVEVEIGISLTLIVS